MNLDLEQLRVTSLTISITYLTKIIIWVLVSEPGFLRVLVHFLGKSNVFTRNEAQEQRSLLDTVMDYIGNHFDITRNNEN